MIQKRKKLSINISSNFSFGNNCACLLTELNNSFKGVGRYIIKFCRRGSGKGHKPHLTPQECVTRYSCFQIINTNLAQNNTLGFYLYVDYNSFYALHNNGTQLILETGITRKLNL